MRAAVAGRRRGKTRIAPAPESKSSEAFRLTFEEARGEGFLEELRWCLVKSLLAIATGAIIAYNYSEVLFAF